MIAPRFYAVKLVSGGLRCAAKVWHGAPADPVTGELLDRSHRWQALLHGEEVAPFSVILEIDAISGQAVVKGEEIDEAEYQHILDVRAWALAHNTDAPEASPRQKIDLNRLPAIRF